MQECRSHYSKHLRHICYEGVSSVIWASSIIDCRFYPYVGERRWNELFFLSLVAIWACSHYRQNRLTFWNFASRVSTRILFAVPMCEPVCLNWNILLRILVSGYLNWQTSLSFVAFQVEPWLLFSFVVLICQRVSLNRSALSKCGRKKMKCSCWKHSGYLSI